MAIEKPADAGAERPEEASDRARLVRRGRAVITAAARRATDGARERELGISGAQILGWIQTGRSQGKKWYAVLSSEANHMRPRMNKLAEAGLDAAGRLELTRRFPIPEGGLTVRGLKRLIGPGASRDDVGAEAIVDGLHGDEHVIVGVTETSEGSPVLTVEDHTVVGTTIVSDQEAA